MRLIVRILFCVLLALTKAYSLDNFVNYQINFEDIFNQNYKGYYVLFYMENCLSCKGVIEYLSKNEKQQNLIVFYTNLIMLDENNRLSQIDNCNVSNYREIQINSVPTLLAVYQGTCINQVEGYQNIISFLNS